MSEIKGSSVEVIDMCGGVKGTLRGSWCIVSEGRGIIADNIASEEQAEAMVKLLEMVSDDLYLVVLDELPEPIEYAAGSLVWEIMDVDSNRVYWRGLGYKESVDALNSYKELTNHPFVVMGGIELEIVGEYKPW